MTDEVMSDDGSTGKHAAGDGPMDDERAVAALFAALVRDAPPSEVSPLEVVRLAKTRNRAALDKRIARVKVGRNLLLAAALVAVLALVLPNLAGSSSNTASTAVSAGSSAADAPSSSQATDGRALALSAPAAATAGSAGSGGAVGSGTPVVPAAGSSEASSAAAGSAADRSPAVSSRAEVGNGTAAGCIALPTAALQAARAARPAGSPSSSTVDGCTARYGLTSSAAPGPPAIVTIVLTTGEPGACRPAGPAGAGCSPVAGTTDAFRQSETGSRTGVFVYGAGYQVALTRTGSAASADELVAAGRAVIKALR